MYNQKKVTFIKKGLLGLLLLFVGSLGYAVASVQHTLTAKKEHAEAVAKQPEEKKGEHSNLSEEKVKEFLIAYYTKKDLEENRPRYKPFMTEGMYKATVAEEDKPVSQAYKGYVLDQTFESANIYIDREHKEVLATVNYSNKTVEEKGNPDSKSLKGTGKSTIVLTYVEQNGQFLVNNLKPALFELSKNQGGESYYNDFSRTSSSSQNSDSEASDATSSSSESSTTTTR